MNGAINWCKWCFAAVDVSFLECKYCGSQSFLQQNPNCAQIDFWEAREKRKSQEYKQALVSSSNDISKGKASTTTPIDAQEYSIDNPGKLHSQDIGNIIRAQNKTTHAVRAFVLFLFYQLSAITTAAVIYFLAVWTGNQSDDCEPIIRQYGACEPQPHLLIIALIVWIFGVVYSSKVGWEEIRKSDV